MSAAPYLSSVANLSFADLRSWVHNCLPKVSQYQYKAGHNFKSTQLKPNTKLGVFGYYEDPSFLPEVAATLTADWACYPEPADRVRFSTLQFVMHTYPQGFNTWWMQTTNDWLPVGYTGYYPIAEGMFDVMTHKPESISDRALVAPISSLNQSKYLYLFNYSIIPQLQKTEFSKAYDATYGITNSQHRMARTFCHNNIGKRATCRSSFWFRI